MLFHNLRLVVKPVEIEFLEVPLMSSRSLGTEFVAKPIAMTLSPRTKTRKLPTFV